MLYRQARVGRGGADFELLKLRTMVVGAETMGAGFAVDQGDSRITRVGRVLRKLSLDELPQLWNVVRGDQDRSGGLAFVGARSQWWKLPLDWARETAKLAVQLTVERSC